MDKWLIVSLVLLAVVLYLVIRNFVLKRQINNIKNALVETRNNKNNQQITVTLIDKQLTELAKEININLEYQKKLKYDAAESEETLKKSVSDIAHDLRTPLTVIIGNMQMLNQDGKLDEKDKEYLNTCYQKAMVLKNMIDNFFEMSVLESDAQKVELSNVNLTNLIMQFVIDYEAVIREHNLVPEIKLPDKTIFVYGDESLIVRMCSNLVGNILKYATDDFSISLLPDYETGFCEVVFGNSISQKNDLNPKSLFDRTYRGDKARSGNGAGLGLYIVKLLAQKQGMSVDADIEANKLLIKLKMKMYINE